jgi:hypothetical protein|nr:MAG TPA: hypothetical protein [Caudoviricetes sp.]
MFFISTESKSDLIKQLIKKVYYVDFFHCVINDYNKETETFTKTMLLNSKYGKQGITLEYKKITNNIFKIISIK